MGTSCERSYEAAEACISTSEKLGKRLLHTPSQVTIVSHFTLPPSPLLPAILQNPTSEDMKVQNNRTVKIAAGMALCICSSGSRVFRFPSLCPVQQPHVRDSYAARFFCKYQAATTRLSLCLLSTLIPLKSNVELEN